MLGSCILLSGYVMEDGETFSKTHRHQQIDLAKSGHPSPPWRIPPLVSDLTTYPLPPYSAFLKKCHEFRGNSQVLKLDEVSLEDGGTQVEAVVKTFDIKELLLITERRDVSGEIADFSVSSAERLLVRCGDRKTRHFLISCLSTLGVSIDSCASQNDLILVKTESTPRVISETVQSIENVLGTVGWVERISLARVLEDNAGY